MPQRLFFSELERLFHEVEKPGRYTGGEWNSLVKAWRDRLSVALVFPDIYEVGMSNLGLKILYQMVNDLDWALAERAFSPWVDMEEKMRARDIPLYSLETFTPLHQFDVVGFSLQYELSYTNILNALHLSKIPVQSMERQENSPLIIAGGPNVFTPEPLADFIDVFFIGEGEAGFRELLQKIHHCKQNANNRETILYEIASMEGVYVPRFYEEKYRNGRYVGVYPIKKDLPATIHKRMAKELDSTPFPVNTIVPNIEIIHDRGFVEIFRGCTRGCRFCQAGMLYRPVRERSPACILELSENIIEKTGHEELSLTSLSTADFFEVDALLDTLSKQLNFNQVSVSLPSLRVDSFSVGLANKVQQGRKTGLTFAPEAGSERLRRVINKQVQEADLINAVKTAFNSGWDKIKLYFMIGLPTETDEDVLEIVRLAQKVVDTYKALTGKKRLKLNISVSTFVPKPHTPFQWVPLASEADIQRRQALLKKRLKHPAINLDWDRYHPNMLETILARGDRQVGQALYQAFKLGAKFDGWNDQFKFDRWERAFEKTGIAPSAYVHRSYYCNEYLPWDHISTGVSKKFLKKEYQSALEGLSTHDCSFNLNQCSACGVCHFYNVLPARKRWKS